MIYFPIFELPVLFCTTSEKMTINSFFQDPLRWMRAMVVAKLCCGTWHVAYIYIYWIRGIYLGIWKGKMGWVFGTLSWNPWAQPFSDRDIMIYHDVVLVFGWSFLKILVEDPRVGSALIWARHAQKHCQRAKDVTQGPSGWSCKQHPQSSLITPKVGCWLSPKNTLMHKRFCFIRNMILERGWLKAPP